MGFLKSFTALIKSALDEGKRYSRYKSMPKDELLKLDNDELNEGIYIILDLDSDDNNKANSKQIAFLTISEFCREINNGGLCQFFVNSSSKYAPFVSDSLNAIGAVLIADLFNKFISDNRIDISDLSSFKIKQAEDFELQIQRYPFDDFDEQFYKLQEKEDLSTLLAEFTRANISELIIR